MRYLILGCLLATFPLLANAVEPYSVETQGKKLVIGLAIRTSNAPGCMDQDAPVLWHRFISQSVPYQIPNRLGDGFLGVYTDYEGDNTKPFTYLLGCEVTSLDTIPEGMTGLEIAPSQYAVFTAKGNFPECVFQTWRQIWNSDVKRAYTTDFEVYNADFNLQDETEVPICISVE